MGEFGVPRKAQEQWEAAAVFTVAHPHTVPLTTLQLISLQGITLPQDFLIDHSPGARVLDPNTRQPHDWRFL